MNEIYYERYEDRYRTVYAATSDFWGHTPDDPELREILSEWSVRYGLVGKSIVEYACGEGASGVILSELGCHYLGVDLAPSAIEKAASLLSPYSNARVQRLDMVLDALPAECFDAALDVMGLHMLLTDHDRARYLSNVFNALKPGAPMLFINESYNPEAYEGPVSSFDDWKRITGLDFDHPEERRVRNTDVTVQLKLLPARPKTRTGYFAELEHAGFIVDQFIENGKSKKIVHSATIYAHKP